MHSLFHDKKPYQLQRTFHGDYLSGSNSPYQSAFSEYKAGFLTGPEKIVLYADVIQKCNRWVLGAKRFFILTENSIHIVRLDGKAKKAARSLQSLKSISLTENKCDTLVVFHFESGGDLILELSAASKDGEKASELVTKTWQAYKKAAGKELKVEFNDGLITVNLEMTGMFHVGTFRGPTQADGSAQFKRTGRRIMVSFTNV